MPVRLPAERLIADDAQGVSPRQDRPAGCGERRQDVLRLGVDLQGPSRRGPRVFKSGESLCTQVMQEAGSS